jgi:hypothetical protein
MTRQRLFGTQLEILLAEAMSPGKWNYNIARYVQFEGDLDVRQLASAIELALSEADLIHRDYSIDADGAWQTPSAEGPVTTRIVDLRSADDPMKRCIEIMTADAGSIIPSLGNDEKISQIIFLLGENNGRGRHIWYQRYHHIQVDGYSLQALLLRVSEIYNSHIDQTPLNDTEFLGYDTLLEEHTNYITSLQHSQDNAFWRDYLAEYVKRSDGSANDGELRPQPFIRSTHIAHRNSNASGRIPIETIAAATMTTMRQVSGIPCQMIGMSFGRRNRPNIDKIVSPMVTVLPLWVDLGDIHEDASIESRAGEAIRKIKKHQFYSGEQAIRDLGFTGRQSAMYAATLNFRVYVKNQAAFSKVDSTLHFVSSPFKGIDITVDARGSDMQILVKSAYQSIYGVDIRAVVALLEDNIATRLGSDYFKTEIAV